MQKKIILFFLCLLPAVSMADLKEKIENVNVRLKNAGKPQEECTNCTVAAAGIVANDGSAMKSCVESICTNKSLSLADTMDKIYDGAAKSNSTYDSEIAPLVKAITKEDATDKINRGNAYAEWLKNPPELKKPGAIRVFNMFTTLNIFSKFQFGVSNGKTVIDAAKSRSAFSDLSNEEFGKKVQIGGKILSAVMEKAITETDPARIQLVYGNGFKDKVNSVIASFAEKQKQIENDPDLEFLAKLQAFKKTASVENIKSQFDFDQINPDAVGNLNQANSFLNLFVALSKDPEFQKMLDSPGIDMKKASLALGTEKILKDRNAIQQAVLSGETPASSAKCRTAFEIAQHVLPQQKDIDLFKTKISGLKSAFLEKTKSLVCDLSSKNYQDQVASWSANLPQTKEQHLANMKESLKRTLSQAKDWKAENDEIDKSPDKDTIYGIGISSLKPEYSNATSSSDNVCDNLMTNILPDATNYSSKSFVAGPLVVKHGDASGVCFHEMAHKLFHFMKYENTCDKTKFGKVRACLLSNHTELSSEEMIEQLKAGLQVHGETKYESEDWADLISAQVDEKENNFACLFAQKLQAEDYKELSLKNFNDSGPHSSDLFRLLHLNFLKNGKIPAQCEQALSARGEKANFKNCLVE